MKNGGNTGRACSQKGKEKKSEKRIRRKAFTIKHNLREKKESGKIS